MQHKMQQMIDDGICGIYVVFMSYFRWHEDYIKVSYTAIFMGSTNIIKRYCQNESNPDNFKALLRLINFIPNRQLHVQS